MADPNPAATTWADQLALAADIAAGPPPPASDDYLTITGTLRGSIPEAAAEVRTMTVNSGGPVMAPAFEMSGLVKLIVIAVVASWIGHALFSGRGN